MKNILFISLFMIIGLNLNSQVDSLIHNIEKHQVFRLKNIFNREVRDTLFPKFDSLVSDLISNKSFCDYKIDTSHYYFYDSDRLPNDSTITLTYSLINNIVYTQSADKKIRVFSYDVLHGGPTHEYKNYIQYSIDNSSCFGIVLNKGDDSAIGYYKIYRIEIKKSVYYMLFGHGATAGGKHMKGIRIFTFVDQNLVECYEFYPEKEFLLIFSNRRQEIDLKYDEELKILSFRQYEFDDDVGFYTNDFEVVSYKLMRNKLKRMK